MTQVYATSVSGDGTLLLWWKSRNKKEQPILRVYNFDTTPMGVFVLSLPPCLVGGLNPPSPICFGSEGELVNSSIQRPLSPACVSGAGIEWTGKQSPKTSENRTAMFRLFFAPVRMGPKNDASSRKLVPLLC